MAVGRMATGRKAARPNAAKRKATNKKTFKLLLETENLAAWMAINNAFACHKRRGTEDWPDDEYWNGVLVQLGRFKRVADEKRPLDPYSKIEIEFDDGKKPKELLRKNYKELWINVVDKPTGKLPPMERAHCRDLLIGGDHKRLHHYLIPDEGGITLWPSKGYRVDVEPTGQSNSRRSFAFEFDHSKDFQVDLYRNNEQQPESLKNVKQITVCAPDGAPGDTHKNPPQRP